MFSYDNVYIAFCFPVHVYAEPSYESCGQHAARSGPVGGSSGLCGSTPEMLAAACCVVLTFPFRHPKAFSSSVSQSGHLSISGGGKQRRSRSIVLRERRRGVGNRFTKKCEPIEQRCKNSSVNRRLINDQIHRQLS